MVNMFSMQQVMPEQVVNEAVLSRGAPATKTGKSGFKDTLAAVTDEAACTEEQAVDELAAEELAGSMAAVQTATVQAVLTETAEQAELPEAGQSLTVTMAPVETAEEQMVLSPSLAEKPQQATVVEAMLAQPEPENTSMLLKSGIMPSEALTAKADVTVRVMASEPYGMLRTELQKLLAGTEPTAVDAQMPQQEIEPVWHRTDVQQKQLAAALEESVPVAAVPQEDMLAQLAETSGAVQQTAAEGSLVRRQQTVDQPVMSGSETAAEIPQTETMPPVTQVTEQPERELQQSPQQEKNLAFMAKPEAETTVTAEKDSVEMPKVQPVLNNQSTSGAEMLNGTGIATSESVTAEVEQTAVSQAMTDRYEVVEQIVEKARLLDLSKTTEMVIKLKPEHLGELTLKISADKASNAVTASFYTENAQVRSALETSLQQLKQELSNQGVKVENVSVYNNLPQSFSQEQSQTRQQQKSSFRASRMRKEESEEFAEQVEGVNTSGDGVDYLI